MYTGALDPISNRADWRVTAELKDSADVLIDLTGAEIELAIRAVKSGPSLTGDVVDGHIVLGSAGVFTWVFLVDEMGTLTPGQYEVGLTIKLASGVTHQIIIGTVSVLDGVVR